MHDVDGHGRQRSGRNRGGVTGAADEGQRHRGEDQCLAAGGDPVPPLHDARTHREEGAQHNQEPVTREPHEPGPRVEDGVPYSARLESRPGTVLEDGRPHQQPDDSRADGHDHEQT